MIDLVTQHAEIEEELIEGLTRVVASGRFVLGEPVASFETALAKQCETRHAVACNSGTDALWLALKSVGVGPGDAVLCPAFSFVASAASIVRLGARPVFCDIDPATLNLDPEDARSRGEATPRLAAVLSVDLFGRIAELGPLETWCQERGVPIVEDAAQSIGAIDAQGRAVGDRAAATCLSFYPTKNLGALGDAGAIVTSDANLRARMARLRIHGESEPGLYDEIGLNSRMDALQAVALTIKLRHLDRWTRARRERARHYDGLFRDAGARGMDETPGPWPVQIPAPLAAPGRHVYHRYVIRVPAEQRPALVAALDADGIDSEIYYARGLHRQPALAKYGPETAAVALPETDRAAAESLALPLYPELTESAIDRIVDVVRRVVPTAAR